jgi:Protein of unknown function (DUF742)
LNPPGMGLQPPGAGRPDEPSDITDAFGPGRMVRPYALTGGRTRPANDIAIEAQITATPIADGQRSALTAEQRAIVDLCEHPVSLAEIAAHARLPLGVVRVLVADLREDGLLVTGSALGDAGPDAPPPPNDINLLERVLHGLRSL